VAQPYLNALQELIASELPGVPGLVCKHFFSGAALYSNMTICASLTPSGLAFKLPEQRCFHPDASLPKRCTWVLQQASRCCLDTSIPAFGR
jgi:hypothetical protein